MNKGIVLGVYSKKWSNKLLWSFKLEGDDTFYRCGEAQPLTGKGDSVEFDTDAKNNVSNFVVVSKAPKSEDIQPGKVLEVPPRGEDVGSRIRYQQARADAARIVCAALQNDHLPHPANAAKGKRLDLLVGYVEAVTKQLLEQEDNNS